MFYSEVFEFKFRGRTAQLRVIRNDGYCWGRIIRKHGGELDVATRHDYYDYPDEDAAAGFIRAARRGDFEPAAVGYLIGWAQP